MIFIARKHHFTINKNKKKVQKFYNYFGLKKCFKNCAKYSSNRGVIQKTLHQTTICPYGMF